MRVRDAEEAVELANEGPYGLQASVWTRDHERGEQIARRIETGVACVNDAQLNYAALELPMGGWKASGLGSRHGPDGIRKYTKRQSILVTPGYAPSREAHHYPYSAQASQAMGETFAALATSDLFDDSPARHAASALRHVHPVARASRGRRTTRTASGRASATDAVVPEGVEVALLQAALPDEQVTGLRSLLDSLADEGMAASTPQAAREQIVDGFCRPEPRGAGRDRDAARAGDDALLRAARPRHRAATPPGTRSATPGPTVAPPRDRERPLVVRKPEASNEVIEADVCVVGSGAGGGVIAAELAAGGRSVVVLEAGGYHDDADFDGLELSAYQRLYLNGGPFPTADGQVSLVAGTGVGGGTVVNWTNCLRTFDHVRAEWAARARPLRPRRGRLRRAPRRRLRAASGERRLQRPQWAAPSAEGGLRQARLRLPDDHPQRRPRALHARERRLHGLRRPHRLEAVDREDLPGRRAGERRGDPRRLSGRAGPGRRRPRGRGRGLLVGSGAGRRKRRRRDPPRGPGTDSSSSPAGRSSRRRCCFALGSAGRRWASTCGCTRRWR